MIGYSRCTDLLIAEFFGSLVFFFLMAAMYEGLKYFREILLNFAMKKRKERKSKVDTLNGVEIDERYLHDVMRLLIWYVGVGVTN